MNLASRKTLSHLFSFSFVFTFATRITNFEFVGQWGQTIFKVSEFLFLVQCIVYNYSWKFPLTLFDSRLSFEFEIIIITYSSSLLRLQNFYTAHAESKVETAKWNICNFIELKIVNLKFLQSMHCTDWCYS